MKKKIFGITLAVCLIVLSIASTTMAYFTSVEEKSNVFTAGNVLIDLNDNVLSEVGNKVFPGQTVASEAIVSNAGSEEAYVGVIITFDKAVIKTDNSDVNSGLKSLFKLPINENFEVTYSGGNTVYVIYKSALASEKNVTFFDGITIPKAWDNDEMESFAGTTITVKAYATQTYGFTDAKTALKTAFPDASAWGTIA